MRKFFHGVNVRYYREDVYGIGKGPFVYDTLLFMQFMISSQPFVHERSVEPVGTSVRQNKVIARFIVLV